MTAPPIPEELEETSPEAEGISPEAEEPEQEPKPNVPHTTPPGPAS